MPPSPPTRRRRWIGGLLLGLALLAGLIAVLPWLLAPLVRSQIEQQASQALGRGVRLGEVELSLWRLQASAKDLVIDGTAGSPRPLLRAVRLFADVDARSLWRRAPVLQALELHIAELNLARTAPGHYDIDDILERLAARPAAASEEPARFALYNLQLRLDAADFDDRPLQRRRQLRELRLSLPFLSNLPDALTVDVTPRLSFRLDGAAVELQGHALPFSANRASTLSLAIDQADLDAWWAYLPAGLPLAPQGGQLRSALQLSFAQAPKAAPQLEIRGELSLKDLRLQNPPGAPQGAASSPPVAWRELKLQGMVLQPLQQRLSIAHISLDGLALALLRDAQGQVQLFQAAPAARTAAPRPAAAAGPAGAASAAPPASAPASSAAPSPPGWQVEVAALALREAGVHWLDASTRPRADYQLRGLSLEAERLRWPMGAPLALKATAALQLAGRFAAPGDAQLSLAGQLGGEAADLRFEVQQLALDLLSPYLSGYLRPALTGQLQTAGQLRWSAAAGSGLTLKLDALQVERLRLAEADTAARAPGALELARLQLSDLQLDTASRQLGVRRLQLQQPSLRVQRSAKGRLNLEGWLVEAAAGAEPAGDARDASAAGPWRMRLQELALDKGRLSWIDEAVPVDGQALQVHAEGLQLALKDLQWPAAGTPSPLQLQVQLASGFARTPAGRAELRGRLGLAPLSWQGPLKLERLSAALFEPYLAPLLPLRLERAELGWQGEIQARQEAAGWRVDAAGDARIADLDVRSKAAATGSDTQLLAWNALQASGLRLALQPGARPRVDIGLLQLDDYYARLLVNEQGRFNLSDLQGGEAVAGKPAPAASAAANAPPKAADNTPLPVDLTIGNTRLARGRVDFSDRFIRPNYSAALSDLEGSIGRVSSASREMAAVELRGRVAGTGLLDIRGSVNPMVKPLAMDLKARATDLELAPLSPYSGKYAGYAIERGKLSVDLTYRIDASGRLEASNQIILNQLSFGEKVDSPDATKLPVRFALSLLADRNGVIDINLPVSGSIDDPQFSVVGIVFRLIGNLIVKALTAPFAWLAGGGGEEASQLAFEPGSARLRADSLASLDRVAKALSEKPALRLTVAGSADASELAALQDEAMQRSLQEEALREQARSGSAGASASAGAASAIALPPPGTAAHTALVKRLYERSKLPNKPRNLLGLAKDLPPEEMLKLLREALPMPADPWRDLALQRGLVVRDALIARGLPSERLFLGAPKPRDAADAGWTPRAELALSVP